MNCFKYFLTHLNVFSFLIKTKTDETIVRPSGYGHSKYDPSIDYDELIWQLYYSKHKGEEVAEDFKRIIESYNPENYWGKIEGAKND
jgi:hypothetical protein